MPGKWTVPDEDKYKYIDDLAVLEAVNTSDKLIQYNVWQHIPTDVATEQKFLQIHLNHNK